MRPPLGPIAAIRSGPVLLALSLLVLVLSEATTSGGFLPAGFPNRPRTSRDRIGPIRHAETASAGGGSGTSRDCASLTERTVTIPKPMGIVIEEMDGPSDDDGGPRRGVCIVGVDPVGNAASACRSGCADLCLRDMILAVDGSPCSDSSFDDVMDAISSSTGEGVSLTLGRPSDSVAVRFPSGVCVAAEVGEYIGNVAGEAGFGIRYSCRSGSCGTCEHAVRVDGGGRVRYVRPCSARVPRGPTSISVLSWEE